MAIKISLKLRGHVSGQRVTTTLNRLQHWNADQWKSGKEKIIVIINPIVKEKCNIKIINKRTIPRMANFKKIGSCRAGRSEENY